MMLTEIKSPDVFVDRALLAPIDARKKRVNLPHANPLVSLCYPFFLLVNRLCHDHILSSDQPSFDLVLKELGDITLSLESYQLPSSIIKITPGLCYYFADQRFRQVYPKAWTAFIKTEQNLGSPWSQADFEKLTQHCLQYPKEYHIIIEVMSTIFTLLPNSDANSQHDHLHEQMLYQTQFGSVTQNNKHEDGVKDDIEFDRAQLYIIFLLLINLAGIVWVVFEYFQSISLSLIIQGWLR